MSVPIAVVGMAVRVPGAATVDDFSRLLAEGRECLTFYDADELVASGIAAELVARPDYVRAGGGVLPGIELFDAGFFGIAEHEAELLDPQHRLFLELAWEALENAGHAGSRDRQIGLFAGASLGRYGPRPADALGDGMAAAELRAALENDKDFLTSRVAHRLDLRGPAITVQAGSATSLVAVHLACRSLAERECELALAGGVSIVVGDRPGEQRGYLYRPGGLGSRDGRCRPFTSEASGTVRGDGLGLVALRLLDDALRDGDTVHAVIRGSAVRSDGARGIAFGAPSVDGYGEAVAGALAAAGAAGATIGLVEAHGIAAPLADAVEVTALTGALGANRDPCSCALGSVKANVGHLNTAAGVVSLLKAVLAVRDGVVAPLGGGGEPNPLLRLEDGPFFLPSRPTPWPAAARPRRAGVSAFGGGGTHVHVVVEEPPPPPPRAPRDAAELVVVSARSRPALERAVDELAACLRSGAAPLRDVAHTLRVGRRTFAHRRAVIAADAGEAAARLAGAQDGSADGRPTWPDRGARRVPLPTYPFQRLPYWRSPEAAPTERS